MWGKKTNASKEGRPETMGGPSEHLAQLVLLEDSLWAQPESFYSLLRVLRLRPVSPHLVCTFPHIGA